MPPPQNDKNGQDWLKARQQILGEFNANQQHLLTQNGHVTLSPQQQRQEGEHNCRDAERAVDQASEWYSQKLIEANEKAWEERQNLIAEAVLADRIQTREKADRIARHEEREKIYSTFVNILAYRSENLLLKLQMMTDYLKSLLLPNKNEK